MSHRWTHDIPNATDGIFYSGLTGSDNRGETVAIGHGAPAIPSLSCGEEKCGESRDLGVQGPPREHWLNPRDTMWIAQHRAVKTERSQPGGPHGPPTLVMCYTRVWLTDWPHLFC